MKKDRNIALLGTVGLFLTAIALWEVLMLIGSLHPEVEYKPGWVLREFIYPFVLYVTGTLHFLFITLALKIGKPRKFYWIFFTLPPVMLRSAISLLVVDYLEKGNIETAKEYFLRTVEPQSFYNLDKINPGEPLKQRKFKEFFFSCLAYAYAWLLNLIEILKHMSHGHSELFIEMIAYHLRRRNIDVPLKTAYLEFILDHIDHSGHFHTEIEKKESLAAVALSAATLPLEEAEKILPLLPEQDSRQLLYSLLVKEHFMRQDFLIEALEQIKNQQMLSDTLAELIRRLNEVNEPILETEERRQFVEIRKHILMTAKGHLLNWEEFAATLGKNSRRLKKVTSKELNYLGVEKKSDSRHNANGMTDN